MTFVIIPVESFFMFSFNYFPLSSLPLFFLPENPSTPLWCIENVSEIEGWNVSSLYDDE